MELLTPQPAPQIQPASGLSSVWPCPGWHVGSAMPCIWRPHFHYKPWCLIPGYRLVCPLCPEYPGKFPSNLLVMDHPTGCACLAGPPGHCPQPGESHWPHPLCQGALAKMGSPGGSAPPESGVGTETQSWIPHFLLGRSQAIP